MLLTPAFPDISTHALREEGDMTSTITRLFGLNFYPRPPRGGRRLKERGETVEPDISTHALREEGDTRCRP